MNSKIELLTDLLAFGVGSAMSSYAGGTYTDMLKAGAEALGTAIVCKDIIAGNLQGFGVDVLCAAAGSYLPMASGTGVLKSAVSAVAVVRGSMHVVDALSKEEPQPVNPRP